MSMVRDAAPFVAELGLGAVQVELAGAVKVCREPDYDRLFEASGPPAAQMAS
jgi:hypothetical protein